MRKRGARDPCTGRCAARLAAEASDDGYATVIAAGGDERRTSRERARRGSSPTALGHTFTLGMGNDPRARPRLPETAARDVPAFLAKARRAGSTWASSQRDEFRECAGVSIDGVVAEGVKRQLAPRRIHDRLLRRRARRDRDVQGPFSMRISRSDGESRARALLHRRRVSNDAATWAAGCSLAPKSALDDFRVARSHDRHRPREVATLGAVARPLSRQAPQRDDDPGDPALLKIVDTRAARGGRDRRRGDPRERGRHQGAARRARGADGMTDPRRRVPSVDAVPARRRLDAVDRKRLTVAVRDVLTKGPRTRAPPARRSSTRPRTSELACGPDREARRAHAASGDQQRHRRRAPHEILAGPHLSEAALPRSATRAAR